MITRQLWFTFTLVLASVIFSYAQENLVKNDSILKVEQNEQAAKELQKEIDKVEKEAKKAEKAKKKAEREVKKMEKSRDKVVSLRKAISKGEKKIVEMREKMEVYQMKGKLSPNDIAKTHKKLDKLQLALVKDKEKLRKLERKL